MKVPAVTVDVTEDRRVYIVTALPWPSIEVEGHPFTARLPKARYTADALGAFVKKLMATYPKVVQ